MTFKILLDNFTKIKKFIGVTSNIVESITLYSGDYVVDGKSILGIYSLDLTKPIEMVIDGINNYAELFSEFYV